MPLLNCSIKTANWQQLDPKFHDIAERAALEHELQQFAQDLPVLRQQPQQLQQRIATLLANRGRCSPPPYYFGHAGCYADRSKKLTLQKVSTIGFNQKLP
jgi:hypothetical protein